MAGFLKWGHGFYNEGITKWGYFHSNVWHVLTIAHWRGQAAQYLHRQKLSRRFSLQLIATVSSCRAAICRRFCFARDVTQDSVTSRTFAPSWWIFKYFAHCCCDRLFFYIKDVCPVVLKSKSFYFITSFRVYLKKNWFTADQSLPFDIRMIKFNFHFAS